LGQSAKTAKTAKTDYEHNISLQMAEAWIETALIAKDRETSPLSTSDLARPLHGQGAVATAAFTLLIRADRFLEFKRELPTRLWKLFQDTTGAPEISATLTKSTARTVTTPRR
jgi:hypothetical protein